MCGQELSPESYAIRKADDPGSDVANIVFGNTLSISRRDVPGIHDRPAPERDALTVLTALVSSRGRRVAALHVLVPQVVLTSLRNLLREYIPASKAGRLPDSDLRRGVARRAA